LVRFGFRFSESQIAAMLRESPAAVDDQLIRSRLAGDRPWLWLLDAMEEMPRTVAWAEKRVAVSSTENGLVADLLAARPPGGGVWWSYQTPGPGLGGPSPESR